METTHLDHPWRPAETTHKDPHRPAETSRIWLVNIPHHIQWHHWYRFWLVNFPHHHPQRPTVESHRDHPQRLPTETCRGQQRPMETSRIWLVNIPHHIQWHHWYRFWLVNFPHHHPRRPPTETTHGDYPQRPAETTCGDPRRPPTETTHGDPRGPMETHRDYPQRPAETTHRDHPWRLPMETTHRDHPQRLSMETTSRDPQRPPMETTHRDCPRRPTKTRGDYPQRPTETTHGDPLRHLEFDWSIFPTTFNDIIRTDFDWLISPSQPIRSLGLNNLINIKSWFFPHHLFEKSTRSQNRWISWLVRASNKNVFI